MQPIMPTTQLKERREAQKKQLRKEEDKTDTESKNQKDKFWPQIEAKEATQIKQPHPTIKHVYKKSKKHKNKNSNTNQNHNNKYFKKKQALTGTASTILLSATPTTTASQSKPRARRTKKAIAEKPRQRTER